MAYNPGITNRSGEILAQATASAAQTRMQGYQNLTNSVLKGFTDLTKEQQEEEVKRNDTRARISADPTIRTAIQNSNDKKLIDALAKLDETPKTGFWSKLAPQGDRKNSEFLSKYVTDTYEQQGRKDRATMLGLTVAAGAREKAAGDIAAQREIDRRAWIASINTSNEAGVKNLTDYNTFKAAQEKREGDLRNEQVALGNQFISGARNDLGGDSLVSGIGGKAYAPPPVKQFDTLPKYPQLGNMGMPSPKREPASQIMMPRSVPRLNLPEALPQAAPEYDTPEKINELVYNFTPGSNSAIQQMRSYGNMLTPELADSAFKTQAAMSVEAARADRARVTAINNRIRRDAADARNRQVDARADKQLELAIAADERATIGQGITQTSAANTAAQQTNKTARGNRQADRQKRMDREIAGDPQTMKMLKELAENNFVVSKKDRSNFEKYVDSLNISEETKDGIIEQLRE